MENSLETLAEEIKSAEQHLAELRKEYKELRTAGLRAAIDARNEADKVLREEMYLHKEQNLLTIIEDLKKKYTLDPDMEPILTVPEFNTIRELDLEKTVNENKIFSLSLLTLSGFEEGDIYVTVRVFK